MHHAWQPISETLIVVQYFCNWVDPCGYMPLNQGTLLDMPPPHHPHRFYWDFGILKVHKHSFKSRFCKIQSYQNNIIIHIQIPPDRLCKVGLILRSTTVVNASRSTVEGPVRYSAASGCAVALVTVASEYHHSTLKGTHTCSNHSGTASYETYIASQGESGCVVIVQ